jgi:hypothetical protein
MSTSKTTRFVAGSRGEEEEEEEGRRERGVEVVNQTSCRKESSKATHLSSRCDTHRRPPTERIISHRGTDTHTRGHTWVQKWGQKSTIVYNRHGVENPYTLSHNKTDRERERERKRKREIERERKREIENWKRFWIEIGDEGVCDHEEKAWGQNPCVGSPGIAIFKIL